MSIADALTTGLPTDDEIETRDHVLRLAWAWYRGELPRSGVRQQSTVHERRTAIRFTTPGTDDFRTVMALLDDLVDHEHELTGQFVYATRHGIFTRDELDEAQAMLTPIPAAQGQRPGARIRFPSFWPWRRRPNKETGDPGERGEPVYADGAEQRHAYANNHQTTAPRTGIADRWSNR